MHRLPFIVLLSLWALAVSAQNPHGEEFKVDCAVCHNPEGWAIAMDTFHFNHDTTAFPLSGQHIITDCVACHSDLKFEGTAMECINCHLDMHSMTVGNDCARCHSSQNWLVDNIPELHESNGFPLLGAHGGLFCIDCHQSDTQLAFNRLGNECVNCHLEDYEDTMDPNHEEAGYSKDCFECHSSNSFGWEADVLDHSFFPLTLGHDTRDCKKCHLSNDLTDISPDCISCHLEDFQMTTQPDHEVLGFDNDCVVCHTTEPGWQPAEFLDHDTRYFPIYSGAHQGEWDACIDCHINENDFSVFSCTVCHERGETDGEHDEVQGYVYEDRACFACHPDGSEDGSFNHDNTNFPLTGAHIGVDCLDCHTDGFSGTSTDCFSCHEQDFLASVNPDHQELNLSNDCINCHTTEPEWMPASFDIHDDFYTLNGAHAQIRDDCAACHNGDFTNTPNTCIGCHLEEYNDAMDPNHSQAGFGADCTQCHTEDAWTPSNFDHDAQYFPIYSGKHEGEWVECIDCHTNPDNYAEFTCINCHTNPETDNQHELVAGYIYEDDACLACHPAGDADMAFDHNMTAFPLTGSHIGIDCFLCHTDGFVGTSTDCFSCHEQDFMASMNPDHQQLNLSNDCINCHTTEPDWMPASFDIHDEFYALMGAHAMIANDCAACHNGDYNNTPNTCIACHSEDYNMARDPDHAQAGFSTDCTQCHTEESWVPSTFDHDGQFFPIYSGKHEGEWMECMDCHTAPGDFSIFTCINCHINPETDEEHEGVPGYIYNDNACLGCHPSGDADMAFDHNMTAFPLTGAHLGIDCLLCHADAYAGTPTDCFSCHEADALASLNPNHNALNLGTDCVACHTTDPGWMPASFDIHDQFYTLSGAHALIANDCVMCHNGDYINTPNDCVGCHLDAYNATTNPNHMQTQFGTDCFNCHTEDSWVPSTFDHDAQYFPINSGPHMGTWTECVECHIDPANYAIFTCVACHLNPETDLAHVMVGGYLYENNACLACHPTGEAMGAFDHNMTGFPLTGGHIGVDCIDCHINGFIDTPTDCFACHEMDYTASVNPSHTALGIPTACENCHTTDPGWAPALFEIHDQFYPLTGEHLVIENECILCHNGDYVNTPNTCDGCHMDDYTASVNPNHIELMIPTDCVNCHTTEPDWMPASFDIHDDYYELQGAHALIADDCVACHNGDYVNTPNTCVGCHLDDYNNTTNPDHSLAQFSTDCETCHTQDAWMPSTFDHDAQYFPIYTGTHMGEWTLCQDCHTNPSNYAEFTCISCHMNPETDDDHVGIGGYIYEDNACLACHPTGESMGAIDHNTTAFPLTGAHIGVNCIDCHMNGYAGTPTNCDACHMSDYNNSTNPDHQDLNLPITCDDCHTTDPGWMPATFDIHDQFYPLTGAHLDVAMDCAVCHNGDYVNTPNTCEGCHMPDYNASVNPDHPDLNIPTTCDDCHTTDPGWEPATFDIHDDYYPLTGAHMDIASDCVLCHNGDYVNTPNTCDGCHMPDYNNSTNPDHQDLNLPITCDDCHTTDHGWMPATFDIHDDYYPLNGAHAVIASECVLCHNGDYTNTPNTCIGCHQADYDGTTEPDHNQNNLSTDCLDCHNEDAWVPTDFDHDDFWPLNGAHFDIRNDCFACHMGDYTNTPTDCIACHQEDYDGTTNPDHAAAMFPTDCLDCHTEDAWVPADFDHDAMYFPIYSGKHEDEWTLCTECHINPNDYAIFSCIDCHEHNDQAEVDDDHDGVAGYVYDSPACYSCHPNGEE